MLRLLFTDRVVALPGRAIFIGLAIVVALVLPATAQRGTPPEPLDYDAVYRIKDEGLRNSQVMKITSMLTDVHGPRLTGSPNIRAAGEWAQKALTSYGLQGARLEPWGPFGRGWVNERFYAHALTPQAFPIFAAPKAWTPGTNGLVTGEAVLAVIDQEQKFAEFKGKLQGKFVLVAPMPEVAAIFDAPGRRLSDDDLSRMASAPIAAGPQRGGGPGGGRGGGQEFARRRNQFFIDEGVLATIEPGRGTGGTIFVGSGGSRNPKDPLVPPQVVVAVEHYGRLARILEAKLPVTLEMNIQNRFVDGDPQSFNVVAEMPGTDKADELVMLGAHFDSWHSGTGATDNAAGSAVMMEAVRILKASGLKMRRTVRIALWTGEEQGLLGSRAYVREHFGDPATMQLKPDHAKVSAYYNVDNGTGAIRGVYLQGNEAVAPIFERWMEPFHSLGMNTLSIRNTGGTDHLAYDAVGLPGFQFIQDPVEYNTRTHHSNMDVYERIQAPDMMKNAVIVAAFVYHTANREERLPRKPLPKPQRPATTSQ
ncbi:MAG: M20/M25/M40 family metallo-hydrolase [Acidobacteria bacterium]|nr:M20/M25/M40 family metallo-hydrolase [Acidobacteriota bacterium]